MPTSAIDQYLAQLTTLTGMSAREWTDFLSCTPEEQAIIAAGYSHLDWKTSPDTFGKVIAILGVIGTIAGVVTGVAGAASAVAALKAL